MGAKISDDKKRKLIGNTILGIIILITIVLIVLSLHLYLEDIDAKAKEMLQSTDIDYIIRHRTINDEGLYVVDLASELTELVNETGVSSISCRFPDETFYMDVSITREDEDMFFEIVRVVDDDLNVSARMNFDKVLSIEYNTGNPIKSTVIRINREDDHEYFAMSTGVSYFLGQDIENVSLMDEHFYYLSYNPKYKALREALECSKEIKSSIEGFKNGDYYYKYGEINFLDDFYQKLSSKVYTVEDRCNDLANALTEAPDEE